MVISLIQYIHGVPDFGLAFHPLVVRVKTQIENISKTMFRYSRKESLKPPAETARLYRTTKY